MSCFRERVTHIANINAPKRSENAERETTPGGGVFTLCARVCKKRFKRKERER